MYYSNTVPFLGSNVTHVLKGCIDIKKWKGSMTTLWSGWKPTLLLFIYAQCKLNVEVEMASIHYEKQTYKWVNIIKRKSILLNWSNSYCGLLNIRLCFYCRLFALVVCRRIKDWVYSKVSNYLFSKKICLGELKTE